MRRKLKRVCHVVMKEGLYTFGYLLKTNLQEKQSEQWKYKRWRKAHEKPVLAGEEEPFFSCIYSSDKRVLKDIIAQTDTEYIGFLEEKTKLPEDVQRRVKNYVNLCTCPPLMIYTDGDSYVDEKRQSPVFKPDYSPDTLRSFFYMDGLLIMNKELLSMLEYAMDKPVSYNGYLLALEASLKMPVDGKWVCHIPEVLYHRVEAVAQTDMSKFVEEKQELFKMYGVDVKLEPCEDVEAARVVYNLQEQPLVSIIIPSKDNPSMLKMCLHGIESYTQYPFYEVVVVDNGSSEEHRVEYEELCHDFPKECQYIYAPMDFNFSKMCNLGTSHAKGSYLLFLNDDIEIKQEAKNGFDWLQRLLGQAMCAHVGAVGAKLLYPGTNLIQHVGVVNYASGAAHIFSKMEDDRPLSGWRNRVDYNYSIVTGACLLLAREKYEAIGGFEEQLAVTFNDVELCIKLLEKGWYQVVRNDVMLYHHESISRGEDAIDPAKYLRHLKEREKLFSMHPAYVKWDPLYSRNMTQKMLDAGINIEEKNEICKVVGNADVPDLQEDDKVVCHIEYARKTHSGIQIGGFIYHPLWKHNHWHKIYVILQSDKQTVCIEAKRLYNPTIAPQMSYDGNLNFVEFYCACDRDVLSEKQYTIGAAVKVIAGKTALLCKSNTKLAL